MAKKELLNIEIIKQELENLKVENIDEEIVIIEKIVKNKIKSYKNKNKIGKEQFKLGVPFLQVYKNYENLNLPEWVSQKIDTARLIGNSLQTIVFENGEKYQINNSLNNLSGEKWLNFTTSVFSTVYSTNGNESFAHEIRKVHPSPKPPQLMKEIINFFTKENEIILDYFMGVGGTLLGSALCKRRAVGIELNQKYISAYKEAAKSLNLQEFPTICGDCLEILANRETIKNILDDEKIGLILIDPPYANMMSKEKTGGDINKYGNIATPFTEEKTDFGNMNREEFYDSLKKSVELILPFIKNHGYIVIFIKDLQPSKKEINLLHADIINKINEIDNINYKGLKIWSDNSAKLFPYGYPFSFVANQIHQYILIFRKEK